MKKLFSVFLIFIILTASAYPDELRRLEYKISLVENGGTNGQIVIDGVAMRTLASASIQIGEKILTYAYATNNSNVFGIAVINTTNPVSPIMIEYYKVSAKLVEYVFIKDRILYVATTAKLDLLRIADDGTLSAHSSISVSNDFFYVTGDILVVVRKSNSVRIYDIKAADSPVLAATISDTNVISCCSAVKIDDDNYRIAYVGAEDRIVNGVTVKNYLAVYDVNITEKNAVKRFLNVPSGNGWQGTGNYTDETTGAYGERTSGFATPDTLVIFNVAANNIKSRITSFNLTGLSDTPENSVVTASVLASTTNLDGSRCFLKKLNDNEFLYTDASGNLSFLNLNSTGNVLTSLGIKLPDRNCGMTKIDNMVYIANDYQGVKILKLYDSYVITNPIFNGGISLGENTASFTITSNISLPVKLVLVTVAFNDDKMTDFDFIPVLTDPYEENKVITGSLNIGEGSGYTLRAFVIDNLGNMNILSEIATEKN